jgi:hypothetical protein
MSEDQELNLDDESTDEAEVVMDELVLLKQRADIMGITYHPNIGVEKLKAKIDEKSKGIPAEAEAEELGTIAAAQKAAKADTFTPGIKETPAQLKAKRRQAALRLVRIRVSNMNPIKGAMKGEIFSVGNADIGMIKKYIPYNAEQGWHVPQILLTQLQNKKFMTHFEVKIGNKRVTRHKLVPELSIEILPPLTAKELNDLKQRQIMANK